MICTVGETLTVGDAITEGICDYAIFFELAVVGGDLKPVRGPHAWDVFKKAIARTNKTKGGVSFSSFKATQREGTMHQLGNMLDKLRELVWDHKVRSFGMLGFSHDYSLNDDVFGKTFEHLKSALEPSSGSVTFLGVWLVTSTNAVAFTRIQGSTQFIDIVIIQTHITLTAKYRACFAYMISQRKEAGDVPNLETAEVALRHFQKLRIDGLRVMLSSTMTVMVYVSAKNSPIIGPHSRNCDHFFMADIDSTCRETLGSRRSQYWPDDMSESINYGDGIGGYMLVFESVKSLSEKRISDSTYSIATACHAFRARTEETEVLVGCGCVVSIAWQRLAMEPVREPVIEPVVEPVMQPAMEPFMQPAVEPFMQPVMGPVTPLKSGLATPLVPDVAYYEPLIPPPPQQALPIAGDVQPDAPVAAWADPAYYPMQEVPMPSQPQPMLFEPLPPPPPLPPYMYGYYPEQVPISQATTSSKLMICTVGETLTVGDAITEGICDYAIFFELAVVGGDLKPVRGPHAWDVFKKHLKSALEPSSGSMTFLGVWLVTSSNAVAFTRIRGSTLFIDVVIIQTHITLAAKYRACYAYMISQRKEAGDVPNLETAEGGLEAIPEAPDRRPASDVIVDHGRDGVCER
ncbi:hypothetical protein MTO96_006756 [Rhipicephalus appendiculatus]